MKLSDLLNNTTTKRDALKPAFNTGEIPTQQNFNEVIDDLFLIQGDTLYKDATSGLSIQAGTDTAKSVLHFYDDPAQEPAWSIGIQNGFELKDITGNSRMAVLNDGKIGIGTNAPANTFHIVDTGTVTGRTFHNNAIATFEKNSTGYLQILIPETGAETGILFGKGSDSVAGSIIYNNTDSGSLQFRTLNNLPSLTVANNGNIGVNTPTPDNTLTLDGTIGFYRNGASPTATTVGYINYENHLTLGTLSSVDSIQFLTGPEGSHTTKMWIGNDGQIGIGTTSPDALLHVTNNNGEAKINGNWIGFKCNSTSPNDFLPYIEWRTKSDDAATNRQAYLGWEPSYFNLRLENGYNFGIMGGKVGIGTSSPDHTLSISDLSGGGNLLSLTRGTGHARFLMDNNKDSLYIMTGTSSATNGLFIHSTGNVGIGTNSPTEKLRVNGSIMIPTGTNGSNSGLIAVSNDYFFYDSKRINNYGFGFYGYTGSAISGGINTYVSGHFGIDFFTMGGHQVRIERGGAVGIGKNNPSYKLDVVGDINRTGGLYNVSDVMFKKEVQSINNETINKLLQLRGTTFQWRKDEFEDKKFSEGTQIGFIAQELKEVYPELVNKNEEGHYSIDTISLIPIIVEANKQQQQHIEDLQTQVANLTRLVSNLNQA
ncbi:hypothetical protein BKI52_10015 [marine bacterium AO1-C]|nr:hypothetical protein BKI52_10015 [marine bacterium AO1-C]